MKWLLAGDKYSNWELQPYLFWDFFTIEYIIFLHSWAEPCVDVHFQSITTKKGGGAVYSPWLLKSTPHDSPNENAATKKSLLV